MTDETPVRTDPDTSPDISPDTDTGSGIATDQDTGTNPDTPDIEGGRDADDKPANGSGSAVDGSQDGDAAVGPVCPECGTLAVAGDRFCEDCGTDLLVTSAGTPEPAAVPAPRACFSCGADEIDADGYCTSCGFSQPAVRDRVELDLPGAAGVSDRGLRHHRNEDAMALRVAASPDGGGPPEQVVVVVCDGVSTSDRPDDAAKAAADSAADVLLAAARSGDDVEDATRDAVAAAVTAVTDLTAGVGSDNAPACTYVSAVVTAEEITVGWVGDSRAYWLADGGAEPVSACLTADDSWAERMVASGRLTTAEAFADPRSHALVAWIGADAGDVEPHVRTVRPAGPGAVLVCSDGLWNYLWDAEKLAAVAMPRAMHAPFAVAAELTGLALDRGGHDNITVVLVPFPHHGDGTTTGAAHRASTEGGDDQARHETAHVSTRSTES
jgi:serine/threonine protein phosphatase PrpC